MTLKEARKKAGLTQGELAKRLGCAQSFISRVETGVEKPGRRILAAIRKEFGKRVDLDAYLEDA